MIVLAGCQTQGRCESPTQPASLLDSSWSAGDEPVGSAVPDLCRATRISPSRSPDYADFTTSFTAWAATTLATSARPAARHEPCHVDVGIAGQAGTSSRTTSDERLPTQCVPPSATGTTKPHQIPQANWGTLSPRPWKIDGPPLPEPRQRGPPTRPSARADGCRRQPLDLVQAELIRPSSASGRAARRIARRSHDGGRRRS